MQLTKKTTIWASSGTTEKPNDSKIEQGWIGTPPEQPPFSFFNWLLNTDQVNINDLIDASNVSHSELDSAISAGGLTPDLTPTGPGNQLSLAIFSSEAIDTPAITDLAVTNDKLDGDLSLNKFTTGSLNIETLIPSPYELQNGIFNAGGVAFSNSHTSPAGVYAAALNNTGDDFSLTLNNADSESSPDTQAFAKLSVGDKGDYSTAQLELKTLATPSAAESLITTVTSKGTKYTGTLDPGNFQTIEHRFGEVSLNLGAGGFTTIQNYLTSDVSFVDPPGVVDDHYHTIGQEIISGSGVESLGIPGDAEILGLSMRFIDVENGEIRFSPVTCSLVPDLDTGTTWATERFRILCGPDVHINTGQAVKLLVHYDAKDL